MDKPTKEEIETAVKVLESLKSYNNQIDIKKLATEDRKKPQSMDDDIDVIILSLLMTFDDGNDNE